MRHLDPPGLQRDHPDSPFVFQPERKGPMTTSNEGKMVARAGKLAGLPFPAHPHLLRHACGCYLATKRHASRALRQ